jgi:protein-S-isoprenylcysteine O-methyltransferase Ste14
LRGELFVIAQFALFGLITLAPRTLPGMPEWSGSGKTFGTISGGIILVSGACLAAAGTFHHGRNLTPFICPKANAILFEQGAYRLVRHPIYSGLLLMAFGWGLWIDSWLTLGYCLILFIILNLKSRREEAILLKIFPGYAAYSARVKRLIPFIY